MPTGDSRYLRKNNDSAPKKGLYDQMNKVDSLAATCLIREWKAGETQTIQLG
jgi:hypothetical protein